MNGMGWPLTFRRYFFMRPIYDASATQAAAVEGMHADQLSDDYSDHDRNIEVLLTDRARKAPTTHDEREGIDLHLRPNINDGTSPGAIVRAGMYTDGQSDDYLDRDRNIEVPLTDRMRKEPTTHDERDCPVPTHEAVPDQL